MKLLDKFRFTIEDGKLYGIKTKREIVDIPEGVTEITHHSTCSSHAEIIRTPKSLKTVSDRAFAHTFFVRSIELNEGLEYLGEGAFEECKSLTTVYIPKTIKHLSDELFSNCSYLSFPVLHDDIESIGARAFKKCGSISSVFIPKKVETIEYETFSGCRHMKKLEFEGNNLKEIKEKAFEGTERLKEVIFPEGLEVIGEEAFANSGVETIKLPKTLKEIKYKAFFECEYLKEVTIPENVKTISESAFDGNFRLQKVTIEDGVKVIGARAFYTCGALEEIVLPNSVSEIRNMAFSDCVSLKRLVISNPNALLYDSAIKDCNSLEELTYRGRTINFKTVYSRVITNEIFDYMCENEQLFNKLKIQMTWGEIQKLKSMGILDRFVDNSIFKNYKNLRAKILKDGKINASNESREEALFNLCYVLGVFDKELTQKSTELISLYIDKGLITPAKIHIFSGIKLPNSINPKMINELTDKQSTFFADIIRYSNTRVDEEGFFAKCINKYSEVQKSHTTNKGSHRELKPTIEKFLDYFEDNKFTNVTSPRDKKIAREIGRFFSDQHTYEKAKGVIDKFYEENHPISLIEEALREEMWNVKEGYINSENEFNAHMKDSSMKLNLRYEYLKKDDVKNLTSGKYCNYCCGHIGGRGEDIAIASILNDNSQTLVMWLGDTMVSKAVFYINEEYHGMVINSIQTNYEFSNNRGEEFATKYMEAIKIFVDNYNKNHEKIIEKVYLSIDPLNLGYMFDGYAKGPKEETVLCTGLHYSKYKIDQEYDGDWQKGQFVIYDINEQKSIKK